MDSMSSFKRYGKVDELEEQAFRRKTRNRLIIVAISVIILIAVVIAAVTGTVIHNRNTSSSSPSQETLPAAPQLTPASSLKSVCDVTLYPDTCFSSISSLKGYYSNNTSDPQTLFKLSLHVAINEASKLKELPSRLQSKFTGNETKLFEAFNVCLAVFDDAVDKLNESLSYMANNNSSDDKKVLLSQAMINDLKTWISASMTDQETCLDALIELNSTTTMVNDFKDAMRNASEYASNSLAIVTVVMDLLSRMGAPVVHGRRLLGVPEELPSWVGPGDRRLLMEQNVTAHVTVAQDGTGDFKTIKEAVAAVPKKNVTRFVIYVKQGIYLENVVVDKSKWNVMIYGDGKDKTIVSGRLNYVDGTATFNTATFGTNSNSYILV